MSIKISNLSISFKLKRFEKRIFEDVNVEFDEGVNILSGESGSGKTTLLKAITGGLTIREGKIYFDDEQVDIFHTFTDIYYPLELFYDDYSLLDNLTIFLKKDNQTLEESKEEVVSIIPDNLLHHLRTKYRLLSSGQRQLVDLFLILVLKPKVIILDEPTANLSLDEFKKFAQFLKVLPKESVTIVSTNDDRLLEEVDFAFFKVQDKKVIKLTK